MAEKRLGGRYELHERIGAGGMGAVYRATDERDGTEVAVKVIRPEVSSETGAERFAREAKHTAKVRHPHVVAVLDSGVSDDEELFLVMELLDGLSLEERLEILPPPTVLEVIDWMSEALDGLAAVHAAGIIHRDLKPGNLFLARDGAGTTVKVLDFGLARSVVADEDGKPLPSLTQTHQFLGTPYYMSPEQVRSAKHIDHRADLFSIGVILYEALAGRRPFEGRSASAVIAAIVADDPPELAVLRPDLPPPLLGVVRRALSRRADQRFDDALAMREALEEARAGAGELRVTPRDVSATAPTALDDTPRRPPMTPLTRREPVAAPRNSRFAVLAVTVFLVAGALGGAAYLLPRGSGEGADAGPAAPLVEAPAAIDAEVAEVAEGPMRLAGPDDLTTLALRFRDIPQGSARRGIRFVEVPEGWVAVALADVAPSAARRMAARMGTEAAPFDGD
ncbi:MAG: serine/threonine protein kinase, partial [Deltaproteobacteria bacterium]|nr:serine/threonine protein kinase [Deltaproteobacteria bacterium]